MPDPIVSPGRFGSSTRAMGGAVAVRLNGELDVGATVRLEKAIAEAVEAADPGEGLILDMHRLTYIDEAGVCSLMERVGAAAHGGHRVAIVGASRAVREVFEQAGMATILQQPGSLADATISVSIGPTAPVSGRTRH